MIKEVAVDWEDKIGRNRIKKEWKSEGWVSAHYLTRRGWNVDELRKCAKRNEISARILNTSGTTAWYYLESELVKE